MKGGGPNPFVPYPEPRPFPELESRHDIKLTPLGLNEGGEIQFVTDAKFALYEWRTIGGLKVRTPDPVHKGTLTFEHTFKYTSSIVATLLSTVMI